jgi:murein DD-endopeptidase MepM/ murein hydrolase activator NlpD
MTPLAYALWLAMRPAAAAEIMRGVASALPGGLTDKDLLPGQPPRAGGYGEDRSLYTQSLFAPQGEEPRTVHLGLDIFAAAGADVFVPLAGRVHSVRDNANPGDYGPTIILEHQTEGGALHTLYGHLSRASIESLAVGRAFGAGEKLARLGKREENGGWPPHLHFQIILDIGDNEGDYPGVCRRSEQDRWLAISPDPRPFLGLPGDAF